MQNHKSTETKQIQEAMDLCREKRFWGRAQTDFQNGKPVVLQITETSKLHEENNRNGIRY